ncbi:hypothetical protein ACKWMY_00675 [Serratia sp. J2]|uniref:hypothetical protein n=1 Tax=Serratia sp. J2 TaxID=3386551 RepID=UPI003916FFD0
MARLPRMALPESFSGIRSGSTYLVDTKVDTRRKIPGTQFKTTFSVRTGLRTSALRTVVTNLK